MNKNFKKLPLRIGVGIVLLNKNNKVFVAKRIDNQKNYWQMPQGGIDKGEDYLSAAYRELEEETSIKSVKLIKELDGLVTYELPNHLLGIYGRVSIKTNTKMVCNEIYWKRIGKLILKQVDQNF